MIVGKMDIFKASTKTYKNWGYMTIQISFIQISKKYFIGHYSRIKIRKKNKKRFVGLVNKVMTVKKLYLFKKFKININSYIIKRTFTISFIA